MDLDWIILYDYISTSSRNEITSKINKFYESFYPLKLKKTQCKTFELVQINRGGLLGIVATYISKVLFALELYFSTEYLVVEGQFKDVLKLSKMFAEIEKENLFCSLNLQKTVFIIEEAYKVYSGKRNEDAEEKGFLETKLICSLNRLFQFYYHLEKIKQHLEYKGYQQLYLNLQIYSIELLQKAEPHLKLYPQISELVQQILQFFAQGQDREPFNFHAHLMEQDTQQKKTYSLMMKQELTVIPDKQKIFLINLTDEHFYEYLCKSGLVIPRELIQNYTRSEEEINALVAEEENFVESILVPEVHRGKSTWKNKVTEQLTNLYIEKKVQNKSKLMELDNFKFSVDFPLK